MGQLKVQLVNPFLGTKLLKVADPVDINSLTKTIKKSEDGGGVLFEVILDLEFIKDGREYLKAAHDLHGGIDADVTVNIYERSVSQNKWLIWGTGKVNFQRWGLREDRAIVLIEQKGIARRVLNQMENDVPLETVESEDGTAIPAIPLLGINYHSKKILQQFEAVGTEEQIDIANAAAASVNPNQYIQFPFIATFDEIAERIDYPLGFSTILPTDIKKYNWRVKVGGEYTISIPQLTALITAANVDGDADWTFKFTFVYGKAGSYVTDIIYTETKPLNQQFNVDTSYNVVLNLEVGDELYLYGHLDIAFFTPYPTSSINYKNHTFDGPLVLKAEMSIDAATLFKETSVKTAMLHEAFKKCVQFYTNQENCFYSELLGRTDIGYAADGKASLIGWTNGRKLRGDDTKSIFANLKELINFVNARFCIGYGFETVDENGALVGTGDTGLVPGTQVFRVEELSHFYNKSNKILSLGKVYKVGKDLISKYYYNELVHGYNEKIDVKQINAIDEFNTLRKSSIPTINTKNKLEVSTDTITGGYQIEAQRRLTDTTEDGPLDDRNFAIVMWRDGAEPSGFRTRKGSDGYILGSFENIYDPESGYNYYLSPGRCRIAWERFMAVGLIRNPRKQVKFRSGTVNYLLKSQDVNELAVVEENGTSDLTSADPLFDPELYTFTEVPFSTEQMHLLEENPYGYFEFEDIFDEKMYGFLYSGDSVKVDPNTEKSDFQLLKVHAPIL